MRFIPGAALAAGKHHVKIEVLDKQGNPAKAAESIFTVIVDKEPPRIAELTPAPGSILAQEVERITAKIVDDGPSGLDPSTLRLVINGNEATADLADSFDLKTGVFDFKLPVPLAAGSQHLLVLTVRDRAGNQAEIKSSIVTIVEDKTPPRIDVYAPRPNQQVPVAESRLTAAVYDLGFSGVDEATFRLKLDGVALKLPAGGLQNGILDLTLPPLAPGPHVLTLFVRDRAGNGTQEVAVPFMARSAEVIP